MNRTEYRYRVVDGAVGDVAYEDFDAMWSSPDGRPAEEHGFYPLWTDAPTPGQAVYYDHATGNPTWNEAEQRVDGNWSPSLQRDKIRAAAHRRIRQPTTLHIAEDATREWLPSQDLGRYKVLVEALAQTEDADLSTFDGDLFSYDLTEQDYARNLLQQEAKNLAWDSELRSAGNGGIFSDTERAEVQARVTGNAKVARGLETGVRTPANGAPREWVTMDGEAVENASFYEVSFFWNADQYIPRAVLDSIPEGIVQNQVFCMVYDRDNVYRGWMPFAQRQDGKWETPSDVNYIGIAQTQSSNWRIAIAYEGTDSEHEITSRVVLVPPNSAWSRVRWGGRNGALSRLGARRIQ